MLRPLVASELAHAAHCNSPSRKSAHHRRPLHHASPSRAPKSNEHAGVAADLCFLHDITHVPQDCTSFVREQARVLNITRRLESWRRDDERCGTRCEGVVDSCTCWCSRAQLHHFPRCRVHSFYGVVSWRCAAFGRPSRVRAPSPLRICAKGVDLLEQCSAMAASCAYSFRLPISPPGGDVRSREG